MISKGLQRVSMCVILAHSIGASRLNMRIIISHKKVTYSIELNVYPMCIFYLQDFSKANQQKCFLLNWLLYEGFMNQEKLVDTGNMSMDN